MFVLSTIAHPTGLSAERILRMLAAHNRLALTRSATDRALRETRGSARIHASGLRRTVAAITADDGHGTREQHQSTDGCSRVDLGCRDRAVVGPRAPVAALAVATLAVAVAALAVAVLADRGP